MSVQVTGIDWASAADDRASVTLTEASGAITIASVSCSVTNEYALDYCRDTMTQVVAVDVPFGWPAAFQEFVAGWHPGGTTAPPDGRHFRLRQTDQVVHQELGKCPLSVSTDRIAMAARSWVELVAQRQLGAQVDVGQGVTPPTGPAVIEVYPGATLAQFLPKGGETSIESYRKLPEVRARVVDALRQQFRIACNAEHREELIGTGAVSHPLDALIAALVALCYAGRLPGWTIRRPTEAELPLALREGWIFFPVPEMGR